MYHEYQDAAEQQREDTARDNPVTEPDPKTVSATIVSKRCAAIRH